jgi:aminoglycoside 6'-N-acetyltransferase I
MTPIFNTREHAHCAEFVEAWVELRLALWPDATEQEHRAEIAAQLAEPSRYGAFVVMMAGQSAGLAEVALRRDYVNGTDTSPVAFLEGIYVTASHRRTGVARMLLDAVRGWARLHRCTELASDTALDNIVSQAAHQALGFTETERVVFYRMLL